MSTEGESMFMQQIADEARARLANLEQEAETATGWLAEDIARAIADTRETLAEVAR